MTRETAIEDLPSDPGTRLEVFAGWQAEQFRDTLSVPIEVVRRQVDVPRSPPELRFDWNPDGIPIRRWIIYANGPDGSGMIATATTIRADYDRA